MSLLFSLVSILFLEACVAMLNVPGVVADGHSVGNSDGNQTNIPIVEINQVYASNAISTEVPIVTSSSNLVQLQLKVKNAIEMVVTKNVGCADSWVSYAEQFDWTLDSEGLNEIFYKFRNALGAETTCQELAISYARVWDPLATLQFDTHRIFLNQNGGGSSHTSGIAVGDFNHDGKLDYVVAHPDASQIEINFGNGEGGFGTPVVVNLVDGISKIITADLNNDGFDDIAFVRGEVSSGNLGVLLSNGDETFGPEMDYPSDARTSAIKAIDLNKDGSLDLVVTCYMASSIRIFMNNGNGTFAASTSYGAAWGMMAVDAGDFNEDGNMDVIAAGDASTNLLVYLGNGNGTVQNAIATTTIGMSPVGVAIGDFNGDGHLDFASTWEWSGSLSVALGNGDGTFQSATTYATGNVVETPNILVKDINYDGHLDLLIELRSGHTFGVLYGVGDGSFENYQEFGDGNGKAIGFAAGNFDARDPYTEILGIMGNTKDVYLFSPNF